jgi:hypothetical protein
VWLCEVFNIYNLGKTYQRLLIPYQILAPVAGSTGDAPFRRENSYLIHKYITNDKENYNRASDKST